MFRVKLIDLGDVKSRSSMKFTFNNTNYNGDIIRVTPSCGCTKVELKPSGDIVGIFKADSVPMHLKHKGYYTTSKYITVLYSNGTSEILTIKAIIHD